MADRFLLFSLPRCGSTTLMHMLNCHPEIRCSYEPFNENRTDIPNFKQIENRETLDAVLDQVWERYNGIKHVCVPAGWPFPAQPTLNRSLLLRAGQRVIFLHRRNLLQQIVSNEMAMQTRIVTIDRAEDRDRIAGFRFEPIKEKTVAQRLTIWKREIRNHREALLRHGIKFLELRYEELFDAAHTAMQRREMLEEVFLSLGRDPAAEGIDYVRIDALFDPARSKVNSADTYRLVPGIERIESLCGSWENGWLFRTGDRWAEILRHLRGGRGSS